MITPLDSRVMDANAEALGVSVEELMGNAGRAVAEFLKEIYPGKRYAFFCGHGNNGGDGFAAASLLPKERVKVFCITSPDRIRSPVIAVKSTAAALISSTAFARSSSPLMLS